LNEEVSTVPDCIRVEIPAATINMAIARTVAAAMAARADLTLDQIEDVRLAMDEGLAYIIEVASDGAMVTCELCVADGVVSATLASTVVSSTVAEPNPFAWTVLTALVGDVDLRVDDGSIRLQWNVARDASVQA
jgi:serine/threonine-protein kinase RsbW